jgi:hypothetical protein
MTFHFLERLTVVLQRKGQVTPRRDAARSFYIERLIIYFIYYTKRYTFYCERLDTLRCAALHLETPRGAARRIAVSGDARRAKASLMVRLQDVPRVPRDVSRL